MAEESKKSPSWLTVFTAVLSALSLLGVAYLSFQTKYIETDMKGKEIAFEQNKFDVEQKNRDTENLKIIIPKIISKDEQEAKEGMAILFVLFETRARNVLESVNSALTQKQKVSLKDQLQPALERAQELEKLTDKWIIVAGGDKTLKDAKNKVEKAKHAEYSPTLYFREGLFRTTIGPFPTQSDAVRTNIAIRAILSNDAYVVNLRSWCPKQSPKDEYIECSAQ